MYNYYTNTGAATRKLITFVQQKTTPKPHVGCRNDN